MELDQGLQEVLNQPLVACSQVLVVVASLEEQEQLQQQAHLPQLQAVCLAVAKVEFS